MISKKYISSDKAIFTSNNASDDVLFLFFFFFSHLTYNYLYIHLYQPFVYSGGTFKFI